MSEITLKPCPFCGQPGEIRDLLRHEKKHAEPVFRYFPACSGDNCPLENIDYSDKLGLNRSYATEQEAADAWNNRPVEDVLRAIADANKELGDVLLKRTNEEVDEYNAGHDAGEKGKDIDIARMRYREEHPDRPLYDVFDTGYIMGVLGDYDRLKSMQEQIERLSEMSVEQMGTIRELNVQLASTPEEMRENAESAWLAGMSGTHYEKLQEARKEIERLRAALEQLAAPKRYLAIAAGTHINFYVGNAPDGEVVRPWEFAQKALDDDK